MLAKRTSATAAARRRKSRRGRPAIHDDKWSKVSVVLFDRQVVRMDDVINAIRRKTGIVLTRAALIRALIDGVLDSQFELTAIVSEGDLRKQLAKRLRA
jgi:hypothetical protein